VRTRTSRTPSDRLVERVYSAAAESQLWPLALHEVRCRLRIAAINLIFMDSSGKRPPNMIESGHDPEAIAAWRPRAAEDPNLRAGLAHTGRLVWSERGLARRAYELHHFVNEVMVPGGLFHVLGLVQRHGDLIFGVGVHRPRPRPFHIAEAERIEPVLRHLERAMQVHHQLATAEEESRSLADLLDHLRVGAVLVDARGNVLLASTAARAMDRAQDGFSLNGGVTGATPSVTRRLRYEIDRVVTGSGGATLLLTRPSGREAYRVLIATLSEGSEVGRVEKRRAAALLLITDPERTLVVEPEALRSYFDLSPAEARVTAQVLAGCTTEVIASRMGITVNTVRVHVRNILAKTGFSSRAELIARVAPGLPHTYLAHPRDRPRA
jgi:DNA-binding CsgD family transcriptional regulator